MLGSDKLSSIYRLNYGDVKVRYQMGNYGIKQKEFFVVVMTS